MRVGLKQVVRAAGKGLATKEILTHERGTLHGKTLLRQGKPEKAP